MTDISQAGTKIASGSDDLNIIVWEWERGRYVIFKLLLQMQSLEILMRFAKKLKTGPMRPDLIRKALLLLSIVD